MPSRWDSTFAPLVQQLWRYPVSSLGGERLSRLAITGGGVHGDREYVLVDVATGEVAAPETTPTMAALRTSCSAISAIPSSAGVIGELGV
jgi:uncharacterized protein YcbX